jgi:hypothetical protein
VGSPFNGAQLGDLIVSQVREFVAREVGRFGERISGLAARLDAVEKREPVPGPQGEKGDKGDRGPPGEDADPQATYMVWLTQDLPAEVAKVRADLIAMVEAMPKPQDGRDGKDGESVPADVVQRMVDDAVAAAVAAIPKPQNGVDGKPGPEGKDGRDALQLEILPAVDPERRYPRNTYARHAGGLIRAFRDTDAITLAEIEKSGWEVVLEGIADEAEETTDEGRTIRRMTTYTSGKRLCREIKTACMLDCGVWRPETQYEKGDVVSWGGSMWIAQQDTSDKPETAAWRLSVKKGRDAKG